MALETRIPPPAVALIAALVMSGISQFAPEVVMPAGIRMVVSAALLLAGIGISMKGIASFRRARTTVNPHTPNDTSSLVTTGIYQFTRNPMYLGVALVLVAWTVFLSSGWALIGVLGFVLYIDRFQIAPEERALTKLFGKEFESYKGRVRRWL